MKTFISYPEIQDIIFSKTGKNIVLSFKDDKTVCVGHTMAINIPILGKVEKNIKADITVEEISGMDIRLRYSMSTGMELLFSGARKIFGDFIDKSPLLSWGEDSKIIVLHLDKVAEKMNFHNLNQMIKYCSDISFNAENDGIMISFKLQNI